MPGKYTGVYCRPCSHSTLTHRDGKCYAESVNCPCTRTVEEIIEAWDPTTRF